MPLLPLQVPPRFPTTDHRGGLAQDIIGWDDLQGSVTQGTASAALTTEVYRDTPFRMSFFRSGQSDSLSFLYQMAHRWQAGTKVRPHVHVVPMADPVAPQTVLIQGQFAWFNDTIALPANSGWTTFSVLVTINPGDVFKEKVIDLTGGVGLTPPAGIVESDILAVFIQRSGSDGQDTYNTAKSGGTALANLGLVSFDCHYQSQKVGTQTEFLG